VECFDPFPALSALQRVPLRWRWIGGFGGSQARTSYLTACNGYQHLLEVVGADDQLGSPQCAATVEGCPSGDLAVLNATLQDPAVQAGLQAHTLFGGDPRGVDGTVREISLGNDSIVVGEPCSLADTTCIAIPPAVDSLVAQLRALDALELSKESCASVFPDGFNF
jgi:hypothetical protein